MGKRAKSLRHKVKMAERRKGKAQKSAAYAAMGQMADNTKRRRGGANAKPGLRTRDNSCRNIGDLESHPELLHSVIRLVKLGQYRGRYRGYIKETMERIARSPSDIGRNFPSTRGSY